jgi:hypothetical protein
MQTYILHISDSPLPLLVFIIDTDCVLCEIENEAQEAVHEWSMIIGQDHF